MEGPRDVLGRQELVGERLKLLFRMNKSEIRFK